MLDLRRLRTFCVVAATHNFTRAAAELGYSQSNVTTQIKLLEQELGATLLERRRFSKNVVLTEFGRRSLDYVRRLLTIADEMNIAAQQHRGSAELRQETGMEKSPASRWPKG